MFGNPTRKKIDFTVCFGWIFFVVVSKHCVLEPKISRQLFLFIPLHWKLEQTEDQWCLCNWEHENWFWTSHSAGHDLLRAWNVYSCFTVKWPETCLAINSVVLSLSSLCQNLVTWTLDLPNTWLDLKEYSCPVFLHQEECWCLLVASTYYSLPCVSEPQ